MILPYVSPKTKKDTKTDENSRAHIPPIIATLPTTFLPPKGIPLRKMKQEKRRTQDQQVFFFTLHSTSRFPASWKAQHTTMGEGTSRKDAFIVNVCIFLRFVFVMKTKKEISIKKVLSGRRAEDGRISSAFIAEPMTGFGSGTVKSRFYYPSTRQD